MNSLVPPVEYGILRRLSTSKSIFLVFISSLCEISSETTAMPINTSSFSVLFNYTVLLSGDRWSYPWSCVIRFRSREIQKIARFEAHDIMCGEKTEGATRNDRSERKSKRQEKRVWLKSKSSLWFCTVVLTFVHWFFRNLRTGSCRCLTD